MLELGDLSEEAHAALGRHLASGRGDMIFLFGEEMRPAADVLSHAKLLYTNDMKELSGAIDSFIKTGDLVLLKGSRGCALESLTEMLVGGSHVS